VLAPPLERIVTATDVFYRIMGAESFVWSMGILMSLTAGYMVQQYIEDMLASTVIGLALFVTILIGNWAFIEWGLVFTHNKESNVVAAAGASICAATTLTIITIRVWTAIGSLTNRLRGTN
jgi:hypothetical protein